MEQYQCTCITCKRKIGMNWNFRNNLYSLWSSNFCHKKMLLESLTVQVLSGSLLHRIDIQKMCKKFKFWKFDSAFAPSPPLHGSAPEGEWLYHIAIQSGPKMEFVFVRGWGGGEVLKVHLLALKGPHFGELHLPKTKLILAMVVVFSMFSIVADIQNIAPKCFTHTHTHTHTHTNMNGRQKQ